jgi:hypothetical protein
MASRVVNLQCNRTAKTLSWVAHPIFSLMRNLKKLLMDLVTRGNLVMVVLELFTKVGIMFAEIPRQSQLYSLHLIIFSALTCETASDRSYA